jgi:siroheme synthase-like protein
MYRGEPMFLPVALRLLGRKVVIIGGDEEAARKAAQAAECDACVTVIGAEATGEIRRLAENRQVEWLQRGYRDGDLEGAMVAICCDPVMAQAVREEASRRGVLLNVLDKADLCDFVALATFSRDGLQFGVHSSGKSAALSRRIRERLQRQFDDRYADLTRALGEVRTRIHEIILSPDARREFWLDVIDEEFLDRIDEGFSPERLKQQIHERALAFVRRPAHPPG